MFYSIVIPCYSSSKTIRKVVELTKKEMKILNKDNFEFILVNDCSPDNGETQKVLRAMSREDDRVVFINLAKNAGQHNAIMAGLNYAKGDAIIAMDDDMQTHPSQLKKMFAEFEKGYDIVYGFYSEKKHSFFRNIGSYINYLTVRVLIGKPKELKTSSFWIIRKFVRDNVIQYKGEHTYLQGLFLRTSRNISCIPVEHFQREVGKSNYTLKKLIGLWSNILGFSIIPLRMASFLGYILSVGGIVGAIAVFIMKIVNPKTVIGWPSIMLTICFFSGIILLFLGLIGEYIGRMYMGMNQQPQYVIKEICNKNERED